MRKRKQYEFDLNGDNYYDVLIRERRGVEKLYCGAVETDWHVTGSRYHERLVITVTYDDEIN